MQEERKRKRKEAREEKKKYNTEIPLSPSKLKYQGKRKGRQTEGKENTLKIEIDHGNNEAPKSAASEAPAGMQKLGELEASVNSVSPTGLGQLQLPNSVGDPEDQQAAVILKGDELVEERIGIRKTFNVQRIKRKREKQELEKVASEEKIMRNPQEFEMDIDAPHADPLRESESCLTSGKKRDEEDKEYEKGTSSQPTLKQ